MGTLPQSVSNALFEDEKENAFVDREMILAALPRLSKEYSCTLLGQEKYDPDLSGRWINVFSPRNIDDHCFALIWNAGNVSHSELFQRVEKHNGRILLVLKQDRNFWTFLDHPKIERLSIGRNYEN